MELKREVIYGNILDQNQVCGGEEFISIPGKVGNHLTKLNIDENILSKHLMMIGGTGCGKSNVFYHIVNQLRNRVTSNDVVIIFDTKGDYYSRFGKKRM